MDEKFSRTEMLIGNEGMEKLKNAKVAVFGLGGVGSFVCEGLARSGIGNFVLVDFDKVDESNINRQLIATTKTIGRNKVDVMKERILDINPEANIEIYNLLSACQNNEKRFKKEKYKKVKGLVFKGTSYKHK